ncbi:hypothetical protein Bca52824_014245 [Brassica carinata]|uniref:Uncharacterized protein n=1 Tax=Brassica carinata TaxID=52824 RepID=A0A8X7W182_BRACI|nr:hypothetical protein Bca52824_014245 [Brassica carinata]
MEMDSDHNNRPAVSTRMIALIIVFTTLRPSLIPPDILNVSVPRPGMTVRRLAAQGSSEVGERVSFMLLLWPSSLHVVLD